MEKIILVDFGGTLVKPEIMEEANVFKAGVLQRALPTSEEHTQPEALYKANREFVEKLTGLTTDMELSYRKNDKEIIILTGEQAQNQLATNLFQYGMFMCAKKYGAKILPDGLAEQLQRIKQSGYKLAIVSGVRNDIISGMLQIGKVPVEFDYISGQPPILGVSNEENMKSVQELGEIKFVIGDKKADLEPAKALGATAIWATWGHPSGGEEEIADHTIESPKELANIIPLALNGD